MVTRKEKVKFIILRTVGNFFLLFSIFGMVMTFGPAIYFEIIYRTNHVRNVKYVVSVPPTENTSTISITPTPTVNTNRSFFGQITGGDKIEVISPVSAQFGIVIPKIGANAKINPNVDAGKQDEYLAALKASGVRLSIGGDCHSATYDVAWDAASEILLSVGITDADLWRLE